MRARGSAECSSSTSIAIAEAPSRRVTRPPIQSVKKWRPACSATRRDSCLVHRYTESMTTTIKVSDQLRDRLKEQASRAGLTLGAHLAVLVDAADRRDRMASLKLAIAASTIEDRSSHAEESESWELAELSDLPRD